MQTFGGLIWSVLALTLLQTLSPMSFGANWELPFATTRVIAETCIGKLRLEVAPSGGEQIYWRATLRLQNGAPFPGYFRLSVKQPMKSGSPFYRRYPGHNAVLSQGVKGGFRLKKAGRPDCKIKVTDYGLALTPSGDTNGIGGLIAPLLLAYDEETNSEDEYTWGQESPEVSDEADWGVWAALMYPVDQWNAALEVLAGGNDPSNPPDVGESKDDDLIDEDGDGYDDRDRNRNGEVSKTEIEMYAFRHVRRLLGLD